jgi:hypothetical protein
VILALIQAAKGGDVAAIKLVLERVAPLPRKTDCSACIRRADAAWSLDAVEMLGSFVELVAGLI